MTRQLKQSAVGEPGSVDEWTRLARTAESAPTLPSLTAQSILPRIFFISSKENARTVSERTLPRELTLSDSAVAASSSGASQIATTSRDPSVQYMSLTVAPAF
jgi:hypothetical protein